MQIVHKTRLSGAQITGFGSINVAPDVPDCSSCQGCRNSPFPDGRFGICWSTNENIYTLYRGYKFVLSDRHCSLTEAGFADYARCVQQRGIDGSETGLEWPHLTTDSFEDRTKGTASGESAPHQTSSRKSSDKIGVTGGEGVRSATERIPLERVCQGNPTVSKNPITDCSRGRSTPLSERQGLQSTRHPRSSGKRSLRRRRSVPTFE